MIFRLDSKKYTIINCFVNEYIAKAELVIHSYPC